MENMKPTQGVMINVIDDVKRFIGNENTPIIRDYQDVYDMIKDHVYRLSLAEEIILQERCLKEENLKIKLSILRDYVYARCPFYRLNKSAKDIRVLVSRIDLIYPDKTPNLDDLYKDTEFMSKAKDKLVLAMKDELLESNKRYWDVCD